MLTVLCCYLTCYAACLDPHRHQPDLAVDVDQNPQQAQTLWKKVLNVFPGLKDDNEMLYKDGMMTSNRVLVADCDPEVDEE